MSASLVEQKINTGKPNSTDFIKGVGLAIVNPKGELWVSKDLQTRDTTGRKAGNLTISFETKKNGEGHFSNVLGALAEFANDETLPAIKPDLVTTDNLLSTEKIRFGNIEYTMAVVVYDGPLEAFHPVPHDSDEIEPVGWMHYADFLESDKVRPLAKHAVSYLASNHTIDRVLSKYYDPENQNEQVVPPGHVISRFHKEREKLCDMVPGKEYAVFQQ